MKESEEKKLQEQRKILEKGEEKTSIILKTLLSKSIKNEKEKRKKK